MNIKVSVSKREVWEKIASVFASVILFILFGGFYAVGIFQGYSLARKQSNEQITAFLEEFREQSEKQVSSYSPSPTPTPVKEIVFIQQNEGADWGGPELWDAVNERRKGFGVNPLSIKSDLCTIASIRLNQLLALGDLDGHEGFTNLAEERPDLEHIFENYSSVSEFLAKGGQTPEETVGLWEGTLGHKKLLDGGEYVWGCIYAQDTFAVAITAF